MATDGPTPTPCNNDLYENGHTVALYETCGANHFENLIRQVAEETGLAVDWHYFGGRARVVAYEGSVDIVSEACHRIVDPALEIAMKNKKFPY